MDEKLKSISCYDIWIIAVILFLAIGNFTTPNNDQSTIGTLTLITGGIFLIGTIVCLILCSRLKKYRYMLIYDDCEKVTPTLKYSMILLLIIAGFFMFYTEFDFIKSSIVYITGAVILSYRHIDSEDKI